MKAPKSAYSAATKTGKIEKHIMVIWVDNEAGVLARVVGLFSGRGYNIESLAVAEIDKKQKELGACDDSAQRKTKKRLGQQRILKR